MKKSLIRDYHCLVKNAMGLLCLLLTHMALLACHILVSSRR